MKQLIAKVMPQRIVRRFTTRQIVDASVLVALLAIMATLIGNDYLALLFGIPGYLVIPGLLMQLAIRRKHTFGLNAFIYSVGLSLFLWILGGLAVNSLLPLVGQTRPLQLVYILPFYAICMAIFAIFAYVRNRGAKHEVEHIVLNGWTKVMAGIALLLPILSLLGATTLNNGGSGIITITMLVIMCIYILVIATGVQRIHRNIYPFSLYAISLALLLMYSLRSWHVLGWDINNEMRVFNATLAASRWKMSSYAGDPYNACLSITVLPTIMARLFHLSGDYVFKLLYQLIFAIVPVAIYSTARRFLMPVLALLSSILFVAQTWFFELMPALARQEIALLYFAIFLMVLTDHAISSTYRRVLLYTFAAGIVFSHYSSAYIWLILCVIAMLVLWSVRLFSKSARESPRGISLALIIFGAALMFAWEGPLTHTDAAVGITADNLPAQLSQAFSPDVIGDAVQSAIIGPAPIAVSTLESAYKTTVRNRPGAAADYYSTSNYEPKIVNTVGQAHDYLPAAAGSDVHLFGTILKAIMSNFMTAVGVLLLAVYFIRRNHKSNMDFIALCAAGYSLIVLILMVPYLQVVYNLTRLGLQVFIMLVIPATAAVWVALRRSVRFGLPAIALITALMLSYQTGLLDQFTGGNLRLTLDQPKGTFDTYYVHASEVYSAQWLARNKLPQIPVYADPVAALRLESFGNMNANGVSIFPNTIPRSSYVYLSYENVTAGASFYDINSNSVSYNTPANFLSQNKDLIYSSGSSEIYR
jgi:uncharacterized membrane protein